ncbi:MAG: hypothetical protein E6J83_09015 [Deltaproteobacteria bacterium]|nr:MAG: hypothetical protein E6J83_09015 [Deltaproteobacteria bacterium]
MLEEIRVHPELAFTLTGARIAVSSHALAVTLGVAAGFALALRRARDPTPALAAAAAAAVAALVGAHWLFRAMHGGEGRFWTGGLASTGGVAKTRHARPTLQLTLSSGPC